MIHTSTKIAGKAFIIKLEENIIIRKTDDSTKYLYYTHCTYTHEHMEGGNFTVCSGLHCPFSTQETHSILFTSHETQIKPQTPFTDRSEFYRRWYCV
jgi:hypothetical protein